MKELYLERLAKLPNVPCIGEGGINTYASITDAIQIAKPNITLEMGFNRGSSALTILMAYETQLCSIDVRDDVDDCVEYLQGLFPNRFHFISGDSKVVQLPFDKVNFVYIDGDHSYMGVKADAMTALLLDADYILFDDYTHIAHGNDIKQVMKELDLEVFKLYPDEGQALVKRN